MLYNLDSFVNFPVVFMLQLLQSFRFYLVVSVDKTIDHPHSDSNFFYNFITTIIKSSEAQTNVQPGVWKQQNTK